MAEENLTFPVDSDGNLIIDYKTGHVIAYNELTNEQVLVRHIQEETETESEAVSEELENPICLQNSEHRQGRNIDIESEAEVNAENGKFDHKMILLMLSEYIENLEKFCNKVCKKKTLWNKIVAKFNVKGYSVTSEELNRKFRNLKQHYISIIDNNKSTGRGRKTWPYFSDFEKIFANDASIKPSTHLKQVSSLKNSEPGCSTSFRKKHAASPNESNNTNEIIHTDNLPEKMKNNSPNIMKNLDDDEPVSHTSPTATIKKRAKRNANPDWVKVLLEAQQVQSQRLNDMKEEVSKSNEIQHKRNDLLEKFLEKL